MLALEEAPSSVGDSHSIFVVYPYYRHRVHSPDHHFGTGVNAHAASEAGLRRVSPLYSSTVASYAEPNEYKKVSTSLLSVLRSINPQHSYNSPSQILNHIPNSTPPTPNQPTSSNIQIPSKCTTSPLPLASAPFLYFSIPPPPPSESTAVALAFALAPPGTTSPPKQSSKLSATPSGPTPTPIRPPTATATT